MASAPEQPSEPQRQGISFSALSEAFARAMGRRKKSKTAPDETSSADEATETPSASGMAVDAPPAEGAIASDLGPEGVPLEPDLADDNDPCQLCPRSILEAMLFVGNRQNEPLTSAQAAELMRGVDPEEIPDLVDELNERYAASGAPYQIVGEGPGYRLVLRRAFFDVRDKFYGRVREARLSQAAVDVLAIVAYRQPVTSEEVNRVRGKPSNGVLSQLVRRQLLRIERPGRRQPPTYHTTDRFLELFGLECIEDLPQAEDVDSH